MLHMVPLKWQEMWFNAKNHLGVNETTLREDRNCLNVPSNVK